MSVFQLKIAFRLTPEVNIAPLADHTPIPATICQVAGWGYPSEVQIRSIGLNIVLVNYSFFLFLLIFYLNFIISFSEFSCDERGSYVRGFTTDEP